MCIRTNDDIATEPLHIAGEMELPVISNTVASKVDVHDHIINK